MPPFWTARWWRVQDSFSFLVWWCMKSVCLNAIYYSIIHFYMSLSNKIGTTAAFTITTTVTTTTTTTTITTNNVSATLLLLRLWFLSQLGPDKTMPSGSRGCQGHWFVWQRPAIPSSTTVTIVTRRSMDRRVIIFVGLTRPRCCQIAWRRSWQPVDRTKR